VPEQKLQERLIMAQTLVGIILGSTSDLEVMRAAGEQLDEFNVPFELIIASAHRNPARVHNWAAGAADAGMKVIIAAAGKAAHLAGIVAASTPLPVIAVPMKTSDLGGLDSLLSMVQMPTGVPVATVAINGARNAAILATQILGTGDEAYRHVVEEYKVKLTET
jgi:5-(carboxyamino)imidazole ribonucleotide mutase